MEAITGIRIDDYRCKCSLESEVNMKKICINPYPCKCEKGSGICCKGCENSNECENVCDLILEDDCPDYIEERS